MTTVAAPVRRPAAAAPKQPFKGLAAFEEPDSLLFFGRERARKIVDANLRSSRLTLLYGPSGVGKSSLLRAGVLAGLHERALAGVEAGDRPRHLAVLLKEWSGDPVQCLADEIRREAADLLGADHPVAQAESLSKALEAWAETEQGVLLVILDQFEEYFVAHPDEDGEGTFAVEFPRAVNRRELPVHFLVSIRDDALATLDRFKGRIPALFSNRLQIEHLDRSAAREAIRKPVEVFSGGQVGVEDELVEAVLDQVAVGQVRLEGESVGVGDAAAEREDGHARIEAPYLQLVMEQVWLAEQGSPLLRRSTFIDRLGGAKSIARGYLERAMCELSPRQRTLCAQAFRYLVTSSGAKIVWSAKDLATLVGASRPELEPALETLAAGRILRPVAALPQRPGESRFEIFHDVLAPEILDWRAHWERQQARRKRSKLLAAVVALAVLAAAMAVFAVWALDQRAKANEAEESATAQELASSSLAQLAADPAAALGRALDAVNATDDPEPAAVDALRQALAESRERRRLGGHEGWASLASFSPDGSRVVTADSHGTTRVWDAETGTLVRPPVRGHVGGIAAVSMSPDADQVVTAGDDGTARVWEVETGGRGHRLDTHTAPLSTAEFSPAGDRVVTAGQDGTARIWSAETGEELTLPLAHVGWVTAAHFNRQGTRVVTGDSNGTTRIWDAETGVELDRFDNPSHEITDASGTSYEFNPILAAAFHRNGKTVATASYDHVVRVWGLGSGDPTELRIDARVDGVEFSPDGDRLLAWSRGSVFVWDYESGDTTPKVLAHPDLVQDATFSRDGALVASVSQDGLVHIWEAAAGAPLYEWRGHDDVPFSVHFDPGGERLVTASADGTARIWQVEVGETLRGHDGWVTAGEFNRQGDAVVTAGEDGTARIWRLVGGEWRRGPAFLEHDGLITDASFSVNGELVVTAGEDGRAYLWKVLEDGVETVDWLGKRWTHRDGVLSASFSPDGRHIVTGGADGFVKVWETSTEPYTSLRPVATLRGHSEWVLSVSFTPNGDRVVSASVDGTVRSWLWRDWEKGGQKTPPHVIDTGEVVFGAAVHPENADRVVTAGGGGNARLWEFVPDERVVEPLGEPFAGHVGRLASVAFSSDGNRLVTGGADRTTRVWDVDTRRVVGIMRLHAGLVNTAVYGPDDDLILSASDDGTARIYPCTTCGTVDELVQEAKRRRDATTRR
ncbi:MAG: NACHT and WD repeat domain-containing protein [Gaiellaceae bacterium]